MAALDHANKTSIARLYESADGAHNAWGVVHFGPVGATSGWVLLDHCGSVHRLIFVQAPQSHTDIQAQRCHYCSPGWADTIYQKLEFGPEYFPSVTPPQDKLLKINLKKTNKKKKNNLPCLDLFLSEWIYFLLFYISFIFVPLLFYSDCYKGVYLKEGLGFITYPVYKKVVINRWKSQTICFTQRMKWRAAKKLSATHTSIHLNYE